MADKGTVVIIEETLGTIKKIAFAWIAGTGEDTGLASKTTTKTYSGEIIRLVTVPDGTDAPTDNYDLVINDEDGTDVLMGAGADRDTAATEQVLASSLGCVANDKLSLGISNAGDSKKGTVYLYIR